MSEVKPDIEAEAKAAAKAAYKEGGKKGTCLSVWDGFVTLHRYFFAGLVRKYVSRVLVCVKATHRSPIMCRCGSCWHVRHGRCEAFQHCCDHTQW